MAAIISQPDTSSGTMSGTFGMLKMACLRPGSAVSQVGRLAVPSEACQAMCFP